MELTFSAHLTFPAAWHAREARLSPSLPIAAGPRGWLCAQLHAKEPGAKDIWLFPRSLPLHTGPPPFPQWELVHIFGLVSALSFVPQSSNTVPRSLFQVVFLSPGAWHSSRAPLCDLRSPDLLPLIPALFLLSPLGASAVPGPTDAACSDLSCSKHHIL